MRSDSYEYIVLSKEITKLQYQVQCLKKQMDLCCSDTQPPPTCVGIVITQQPQGGSVNVGQSFNLVVTATGDNPILYQWYKNGVAISGASASTYSLTNAIQGDTGNYSVTLTNPCGSVTSNTVSVTVSQSVVLVNVYWGWKDAPITTTAEILDLQGSGQVATGANTIIANYTQNSAPKYLIMAEPADQPLKRKWFGTDLNKGDIGTDQDLFGAPVIIGGYRVYTTAYKTSQTDTVLQFKAS